MNRLALLFAALLSAPAAMAQLDPPPSNIDHFFTSPGGAGYFLRNDDNPANQGVDPDGTKTGDYYPNTKLLIDALAVDRLGSTSVGNPRGYHEGYTQIVNTPFGFLETDFDGGDRNIWYWDCSNLPGDDCDNGAARANAIHMPAPLYRGASNSCVRGILGHEMAHKWQRAYAVAGAPSGLGSWVTEGQARALQDKIYLDLDTDPEASCVATYLGQVKSYLYGNPDKGVLPDYNKPLWTLSYDAALFWTYLMEQLGVVTAEPMRGIDFLVTWWDEALAADDSADSMQITDATIKVYNPERSLLGEFRSFVLANLIKDMDLSNVSAAFRQRYSYRDEEQSAPLDQNQYAQVGFSDSDTVTASKDGQVFFFTDHYAAQYFNFDLSSCPANRIIRVEFDPFSTAFGVSISKLGAWGVVAGQGGSEMATQRPSAFYKKIDEEWAVEFQQPTNTYQNIYVTTTGVQGPVLGELTVECNAPQTLGPDLPLLNPIDPFTPGPPQVITYGPVGPITLPPFRGAKAIKNLDPTQFEVVINEKPARVSGGLVTSEGYQLFVEHPAQDTPGPHDVMVRVAGLETQFDDAVYYRDPRDHRWVYVLMDQSLSMGNPAADPKLADAVVAAKEYLQNFAAGTDFRAGLIGFALDAQIQTPLGAFDAPGQAALEAGLDNLTPLGPESAVGSAIELARTSFASFAADEPAGRPAKKEIVLFSDGPLSFGASWDAIAPGVIAAGITVHTIALGQTADQPLLARIARQTGGTYRYMADDPDLPTRGVDEPALAAAMLKLGGGTHRQQIARQSTPMVPNSTLDFAIEVPRQAIGLLLPAVQAAPDAASAQSMIDEIRVMDPDGKLVIVPSQVRVITLSPGAPVLPGVWKVEIDTNGRARGELALQAFTRLPQGPWLETALNLPEVEDEVIAGFVAGEPFEFDGQTHNYDFTAFAEADLLHGTLSINDVVNRDSQVAMETVTIVIESIQRVAPKYTGNSKGSVPLDSFTLNFEKIKFTPSAGSPTGFTNEFGAGQRGTYNFEQRVTLQQLSDDGQATFRFQLIGDQSAAVADAIAQNAPPDGDFDGMPDAYEDRHECLDSAVQDGSQDADADQLFNIQEYERSTNPCDSDTDGGGELDGSEVLGGRDPLFARDDALRGAEYSLVAHELTHEVQQGGLEANSILIKLPRNSGYGSLTLKRGLAMGPLATVATLNANQIALGEYVDSGLTAGQEYCYRIDPFDAAGNAGRPTRIFCRVARTDPELPWGDVVINEGAPRTSNALLALQLSMYNKDPSTVSMRFGIDGPPQGDGIAFATSHQLQLPAVTEPTEVVVSVGYFLTSLGPVPPQDEEFVAVETITLLPPQSTGGITLRLTLFNPDGTPVASADTSGTMVQVCAEGTPLTHCKESTAYPAANGVVTCPELAPGNYDVYPMGSSLNLVPMKATVGAGQTTDLGEVSMTIGELFKAGFEGVDAY